MLKAILRKVKSASKPFRFVYFDAGPDGNPMLLIRKKKIPGKVVKLLKTKAKKIQLKLLDGIMF